eukprot:TRINITY_DN78772_c0_g1_i1.p1 TRINITY_DN78772_c0_g1~~TRINITY_DN78772_c0_g1_i1.p1  ORF type:complete len:404 (+),score=69.51 TRINITY_DN78772_c0_g1_i1:23-1234(+)
MASFLPPQQQRQLTVQFPICSVQRSAHHISSLEDLSPVYAPSQRRLKALAERAIARGAGAPPSHKAFLPVALASMLLGVLSVIPYCGVLKRDPGSPLTLSFMLHIAVVSMYLPRLRTLLRKRLIPLHYHAAMVALACTFTTLKSDAFVRLPTSVGVILTNLQMVFGVLVQVSLFGKRYSASQLLGVLAITAGIASAGYASSAQQQSSPDEVSIHSMDDFMIGVLEIVTSCLAISLLVSMFKLAFARFGECAEEQFFVQHLCCLLFVFPSQWSKIGPRISAWVQRQDVHLVISVIVATALSIAKRAADSQVAGRAPSLIMAQLLQTLGSFLELLVVVFMRAPPWPAAGFWLGTMLLVLGTLQYLRASTDSKSFDREVSLGSESSSSAFPDMEDLAIAPRSLTLP